MAYPACCFLLPYSVGKSVASNLPMNRKLSHKPQDDQSKQDASEQTTGNVIKHDPPPGKHEPPAAVQPVEPEDARHLGSGKPVQREMLEKNVKGDGAAQPHPETVAGQHATGSFTKDKRKAG